jgi:hypothetical protein
MTEARAGGFSRISRFSRHPYDYSPKNFIFGNPSHWGVWAFRRDIGEYERMGVARKARNARKGSVGEGLRAAPVGRHASKWEPAGGPVPWQGAPPAGPGDLTPFSD